MSTQWTSISNDYPLTSSDQIRVSVSFVCSPLSKITASDISNFLAQQQSVRAVLDVQEGWVDTVTLGLSFSCNYTATLNPQEGVSSGDIRSATYTALNQANDTHTIKSTELLVGTIEKASTSIIPDPPAVTTTISIVAIAAVILVAFFVFLKLD